MFLAAGYEGQSQERPCVFLDMGPLQILLRITALSLICLFFSKILTVHIGDNNNYFGLIGQQFHEAFETANVTTIPL